MTAPNEAPDTPEEHTALVRRSGADIGFGLAAVNWEDAFRMAKVIADSEMIPKQYRGKPADVVVAMQMGAEVGLSPMASLQSIRVINGQPGLYSDGFLGVIMASPRYVKHVEYYVTAAGEQVEHLTAEDLKQDETKAVSKFWRKGVPEPFIGTFSIADAKRAHLIGKEGPWQEYPQRQLLWRGRGYAGRNGFAAELRGMKILAELQDLPEADITDEPGPRPVMPIRRSEKAEPESEPTPDPREPPAPSRPAPPPTPPVAPGRQPGKPAKPPATPAPRTSAPVSAVSLLDAMVITETAYVTPKDDDPYYEIKASKVDQPIAFVFTTREKELAELAQSAEGTEATFNLTWRPRHRKDKSAVKELVAIAAS